MRKDDGEKALKKKEENEEGEKDLKKEEEKDKWRTRVKM